MNKVEKNVTGKALFDVLSRAAWDYMGSIDLPSLTQTKKWVLTRVKIKKGTSIVCRWYLATVAKLDAAGEQCAYKLEDCYCCDADYSNYPGRRDLMQICDLIRVGGTTCTKP